MDDMHQELLSIQSIYCLANECEVEGSVLTLNILVEEEEVGNNADCRKVPVKLVLAPTSSYPEELPQISLQANKISRDLLTSLKESVTERTACLIGQPALMEIITVAKEILEERKPEILKSVKMKSGEMYTGLVDKCVNCTYLLHLDHMRSKTKYVKTIEKWMQEFGLKGRLIFCKKLILIIVQGPNGAIKSYISQHRSCNVDVDSRGHSCKERMLSVLVQQAVCLPDKSFADFQVQEVEEVEDLENVFREAGLETLFDLHVKGLKNRYL